MIVTQGSTNVTLYVYFVDDDGGTAPGEPTTGKLFSDIETGGSASYVRQGAARTDFTLVTQTVDGAHTDGGFVLVDDTNMPGLYRLDVPDAAFAAGADFVVVQLVMAAGNNSIMRPLLVDLTAVDLRDGVRAGLTALPNAAADAAGGLPISDLGGLDLDALNTNINDIETAVITNAAGADIAADIIAVKAETALIVADTNELQTDDVPGLIAALNNIAAGDVWAVDATTQQTQGTFGQAIGDPVADTTTIYQAVVTDAAGDNVSVDVAAVKAETALIVADTNELQTDDVPGLIAALNDPTAATIADAVWDEAQADHVAAGSFGVVATEVADILVDTGTTLDTKLNDIQGATFSSATDSLEAIRDRGDAAWTTGAGGSDRLLMVDTTIATLATQTSFTLTAGSADDDAYNNCTIVVEDVSTSTQKAVGMVLAYTGSTKTVTLKEALAFNIATTDKVYILAENSLKSTVANRQLDVTATGAAGIDWGNVENPTTAVDLSGTDIQLADTVTTLTGHTAQTGDTFALANGAAGFVAIDSVVDQILVDTGTDIPARFDGIEGGTFSSATDSLEAIRDRGDAAWTTGAGGSDRLLMVDTTIATLATQTSFTLTAGSSDDNAYNNCTIVVEDVSTSTQKAVGMVLAYTGSTKTVTLKEALAFNIATTDKVYILAENALKSTVANRQLDVTATGAAGIDWGNVENPSTAVDLSATDIQLADTVTTLTGHTAQTGDTFALANGANGFANIKTDTAAILTDTADMQPKIGTPAADVSADIAAIKAETALIVADTNELQTDDVPGLIAALNNIAAGDVWAVDATTQQTQGTFGQAIGDPAADTTTIYQAVATDATGDNVSVDVAAVKAETANILTDTGTTIPATITTLQADTDDIQTRLPAALVGGAMNADVSAIQANAITAASIATDAIDADALAADAVDEFWDEAMVETTGAPAVTGTFRAAFQWMFALSRNKITQTSTTTTMRNDADSADVSTSTVSDDGTTYTRGEWTPSP